MKLFFVILICMFIGVNLCSAAETGIKVVWEVKNVKHIKRNPYDHLNKKGNSKENMKIFNHSSMLKSKNTSFKDRGKCHELISNANVDFIPAFQAFLPANKDNNKQKRFSQEIEFFSLGIGLPVELNASYRLIRKGKIYQVLGNGIGIMNIYPSISQYFKLGFRKSTNSFELGIRLASVFVIGGFPPSKEDRKFYFNENFEVFGNPPQAIKYFAWYEPIIAYSFGYLKQFNKIFVGVDYNLLWGYFHRQQKSFKNNLSVKVILNFGQRKDN